MAIKYTIVTNSYHRDQTLVERSLRASLNQTHPPQKVIFIDQNDEKLPLSSDITNNNLLHHVHFRTNCVSNARNSLQAPGDCEWLVFCDDDGYLDDAYSEKLKNVIESNPDLQIIAGSIIRDDNFDYYTPRHKIGGDLQKFQYTKLLMGSNFCVKHTTFKNLNGFDERFGAGSYWGSGEETDFAWKAYFSNTPMKYAPELKVYHVKPYALGFKESVQKAFRYGRGKGALVGKWLFEEKRLTVLYELMEMTALPFVQSLKALIKLDGKQAIYPFSALAGRWSGLIKFGILKLKP